MTDDTSRNPFTAPHHWSRATWRRIGWVGVPAFLIGYLATALVFFGGGSGADVVTVPNLRELTAEDATDLLEDSDLEFDVRDSLPNPTVPRGAVVAQAPLPGREVPPETQVRVILSMGPEKRVIPRVDDYPPAQAERLLGASGFTVRVQRVQAMRAAGRVVGTVPEAGASVQMPANVRLLISAGPPMVAMPAVTGILLAEALPMLERLGLRAGGPSTELRLDVAPGTVLSQSPSAGDSVASGSRVQLIVGTHEAPALEEPEPEDPEPVKADEAPGAEQSEGI